MDLSCGLQCCYHLYFQKKRSGGSICPVGLQEPRREHNVTQLTKREVGELRERSVGPREDPKLHVALEKISHFPAQDRIEESLDSTGRKIAS